MSHCHLQSLLSTYSFFFFSSRRRHTRFDCDWSSDVCSSDLEPIQQTAAAIAVLDGICALAETARLFRYCRPKLNDTLRLVIKDGRHPVLDQNLVEEKFVPNDTSLDGENLRLAIVTGPKIAGESAP